MLNKIIIINSELYSKASIQIGENSSIQITAENNVGKSSFINTLNFLYITDNEQMRFEDDRKLSDSMKHYFDGTSLHSYIIFEIFKNGYYNILVKATPENSIEYYKIIGEYDEDCFIEKSEKGFKARRWNEAIQKLTLKNATEPPIKLTNEELYNLVYNSDKNKNPVVWLKKEVKRNGRKSFSNSFTDIYRHLIRTSAINEKSFKSALLIADGQQHIPLNVLSSSSFEKIDEFERKKIQLQNLVAVKPEFEKLKILNDDFVSQESILGKLKHTFFKNFDKSEKEISSQVNETSELSMSITKLEQKIDTTLKEERDKLIAEKTTFTNKIEELTKENIGLKNIINEVQDYEPEEDNLLYQGLKTKVIEETTKREELVSQLNQLKRSQFTKSEIELSIQRLTREIGRKEKSVSDFDNLLYQNISKDEDVIRKVYTYLDNQVANLDKSKIIKSISKADLPMSFFDGLIDVSSLELDDELPTIKKLQDEIISLKKELKEKESQLKIIKDRNGVQTQVSTLKQSIDNTQNLVNKVEKKPEVQALFNKNVELIISRQKEVPATDIKIAEKDEEIKVISTSLEEKKTEKKGLLKKLNDYTEQYNSINGYDDIYEIEEELKKPFDEIFSEFEKTYRTFRNTRENRQKSKDNINLKLKKDIQDIKTFIREVDEEIINIPQTSRVIDTLLDTLSHEIGSPTDSFITQFEHFKTFVYKSYNRKLAEYPISNIQDVKVKINENKDLIEDLKKISNLKFSDGFNFDNSYEESRLALKRQLETNQGKSIDIVDLFKISVEITKATGKKEEIDLSKQVQSRGTNIVLKLYLFLNILKELVHSNEQNRVIIYVDELDAIGQKNVKHLIQFCEVNHFVPVFAAPRKVEGIQKYYMIKEPTTTNNQIQKRKISFGELQSFPVKYRDAE
jgi:hypothetical protein